MCLLSKLESLKIVICIGWALCQFGSASRCFFSPTARCVLTEAVSMLGPAPFMRQLAVLPVWYRSGKSRVLVMLQCYCCKYCLTSWVCVRQPSRSLADGKLFYMCLGVGFSFFWLTNGVCTASPWGCAYVEGGGRLLEEMRNCTRFSQSWNASDPSVTLTEGLTDQSTVLWRKLPYVRISWHFTDG